MSDQKIIHLQKETGCDVSLAKLLLKFTGGDVEGAASIVKSVEKNIFIIRLKFIAQSAKIYGTITFQMSTKTKLIDKFYCVTKVEDKSAIEFDFEKKWDITQEEVAGYYQRNIVDIDFYNKIANAFNNPRVIQFLESKFVTKKDIDENSIKNFFTDILINLTGDVSVALKIKIDKTDVFEVNKGNPKDFEIDDNNESQKKEDSKKEKEQEQILMLKVDLDLAPVDGVQISDLQIGDLLGVKITDERPISEYISRLLNSKDPVTNENLTLFAELKDIKVSESGIGIKVEFGPGIYGSAHYGEDVKVRVSDKYQLLSGEKKESPSKNNFFFKYFWLIGGALISIIVIVLLLLLGGE